MSFRPVQSPVCPVLLDCGDILDNTNMDAIVRSIHSIHEAGHILFTSASNRVGLQLIPLVGQYGNSITFATVLSNTFPIEIFPGFTHYSIIAEMKLYQNPANSRHQTISISITNGASTQVLMTKTSNPAGSGYIGSAQQTISDWATLNGNIYPVAGNSVAGTITVTLTPNFAATVNGLGSSFYYGCLALTIKQFKPC